MTKQIAAARKSLASRRAVIQVAAVLGILRALRVIELRDEWRRSAQRLADEKALKDFFRAAPGLLAVGEDAVIPRLLEDLDGDLCEELSMVLGLMTWLAWECGVDIEIARSRSGGAGVEADQWSALQRLAYLAPHCATDGRALELALASVRETPRRGQAGDAWFERQQSFMTEIALATSKPGACSRVTRPPRVGGLVFLASQFDPRVRLVVNVQTRRMGATVSVIDETAKDGVKKFLAERVERLAVPAGAGLDVG